MKTVYSTQELNTSRTDTKTKTMTVQISMSKISSKGEVTALAPVHRVDLVEDYDTVHLIAVAFHTMEEAGRFLHGGNFPNYVGGKIARGEDGSEGVYWDFTSTVVRGSFGHNVEQAAYRRKRVLDIIKTLQK